MYEKIRILGAKTCEGLAEKGAGGGGWVAVGVFARNVVVVVVVAGGCWRLLVEPCVKGDPGILLHHQQNIHIFRFQSRDSVFLQGVRQICGTKNRRGLNVRNSTSR